MGNANLIQQVQVLTLKPPTAKLGSADHESAKHIPGYSLPTNAMLAAIFEEGRKKKERIRSSDLDRQSA